MSTFVTVCPGESRLSGCHGNTIFRLKLRVLVHYPEMIYLYVSQKVNKCLG